MNPDSAQPTLEPEANALVAAYAALNRNDVDGFVENFDPQIERVEPPGFPMAGTYRGFEAVRAHIATARGTWAEGACEVERFLIAGDKVILFIHVHVRLKAETVWRDGRLADVFTFRDGKAVYFRTFGDSAEALEWAGVR